MYTIMEVIGGKWPFSRFVACKVILCGTGVELCRHTNWLPLMGHSFDGKPLEEKQGKDVAEEQYPRIWFATKEGETGGMARASPGLPPLAGISSADDRASLAMVGRAQPLLEREPVRSRLNLDFPLALWQLALKEMVARWFCETLLASCFKGSCRKNFKSLSTALMLTVA